MGPSLEHEKARLPIVSRTEPSAKVRLARLRQCEKAPSCAGKVQGRYREGTGKVQGKGALLNGLDGGGDGEGRDARVVKGKGLESFEIGPTDALDCLEHRIAVEGI
jgi:hypothetical protein